ncbi:hypothetical protein [Ohtaekwangia sp.]|uniref:hypothetical protein n=1 Tax=Ohtaekwangia sp. TaxID=2066019 RepID=UPI002FDE6338
MRQVIQVRGVSIKASPAKDKSGREGFFIAKSELTKSKAKDVIVIKTVRAKKTTSKKTTPTKRVAQKQIRPEVQDLLTEMKDYKDGKLKLRSLDDVV